jgi:hypothetical protein
MKKVNVNFGGFYYSLHSELIDSMVQMYEDTDNEDEVIEFDNYNQLHIKYSKHFVSFLNELMDCNLKFINFDSPKYYNYSTDKIVCKYTKKDFNAIKKYAKVNNLMNDIELHIKRITTSVDGYWAFYEYNEVFFPENESILIQCYLDVIIKKSVDEWFSYYDMQNVYEIIYSL